MRRSTTLIACATLLLSTTGCDPSPQEPAANVAAHQATSTTTSPLAGNLCERLRPSLSGSWKVEVSKTALGAPASEQCMLTDEARPAYQIHVGLSILPVTTAQSAELRKNDERDLPSNYVAKVIDGGIGNDSWALDPAAAAPWLIFRTANRLISLSVENASEGTLADLRTMAKTITTLPGGLPAMPAAITRPECARGTAAAEHVLGAKAVVRRDVDVDGFLFCGWASATHMVQVRSGTLGSQASLDFAEVQGAGTDRASWVDWVRRVPVGAEGWQQDNSFLVFRTAKPIYVEISSEPMVATNSASIAELARVIAPAYGG